MKTVEMVLAGLLALGTVAMAGSNVQTTIILSRVQSIRVT